MIYQRTKLDDYTIELLSQALEWALGCIEGGPEEGCGEWFAAKTLLSIVKNEPYWISEVHRLKETLDENLNH